MVDRLDISTICWQFRTSSEQQFGPNLSFFEHCDLMVRQFFSWPINGNLRRTSRDLHKGDVIFVISSPFLWKPTHFSIYLAQFWAKNASFEGWNHSTCLSTIFYDFLINFLLFTLYQGLQKCQKRPKIRQKTVEFLTDFWLFSHFQTSYYSVNLEKWPKKSWKIEKLG